MSKTESISQLKAKLNSIYTFADEKLNSFHKEQGESLNSRQVLNDFLVGLGHDIDKLTETLKEEYELI